MTRSQAKKTASKVFGYSVAGLISLAYINMGCALDLEVLKSVVKRPIGPAIGFVAQVRIISFEKEVIIKTIVLFSHHD